MKVDEEAERDGFALRGGELEDRTQVRMLGDLDTRSHRQKIDDRLVLLVLDGPEKRRGLLVIADVHFGAMFDQKSAGSNVA